MPTVYLPGEIAQHTGGLDAVVIDASRVHEVMEALTTRFPGAAEALARMAVAIDGEIHNDPDYIDLRPESEVHLVPRIAGGSR
jgi:molybdopterin converting factor small subunit